MSDADALSFGAALDEGVPARLQPVYCDIRDEIVALSPDAGSYAQFARAAASFIERQVAHLAEIAEAASVFEARHAAAIDDEERHAAILSLAEVLGADAKRLRRDRKALRAWFDADAVMERARLRSGERERALTHAVDRLGWLTGRAMAKGELASEGSEISERIAPLLADMRQYQGDARIRQAAHRALLHMATHSPGLVRAFWAERALRDTRRVALDAGEDVWAQCDALSSLVTLSAESLPPVLDQRLAASSTSGPEDRRDNRIFVRRHIARILCRHAGTSPKLVPYLSRIANDRNGAVRQALAEALPSLPTEIAGPMAGRMRIDQDPQVRGALFSDMAGLYRTLGPEELERHLLRVLDKDRDDFVLRIALTSAADLVELIAQDSVENARASAVKLAAAIEVLRERTETIKLRRWAGETRERIWLACNPQAQAVAADLRAASEAMVEGTVATVPSLGDDVLADPDLVGRVMGVLAQRHFGLDLDPSRKPRLQLGERLRRRWWRILFEGRHAATDKRQAHLHTIGRHFTGSISAPSARMGELAPTKVPGEPLVFGVEGGWRNYLPLLDQVLHALDRGKPLRVYTSEGVTTIAPPAGLAGRVRAFWRVSRRFVQLATLRNNAPEDYTAALRGLGVDITFTPWPAQLLPAEGEPVPSADPSVVRLFSIGGAAIAVPPIVDVALRYFSTVYANTLFQLAMFLALISLWFFGRHIWKGRQARALRDNLSLVLGGWGTRGKSGTERLKAGLVNALGAPLISKTTGCEAMFLRGPAFGDLVEMFLFRPYDKATIWEQYNLLKISDGLKARVFLWECMGLNPAYVKVLQRDWMRDDIATITNTYPDHEDVQGPSGRDIPTVMCEFIPENSLLLTTEEEMVPILREGAAGVGTQIQEVGWREAGLVHAQLLARFPYEEHPYNIALVTQMGAEMGLQPDFSVREMADRVVADLGVLKTYPRSSVDGRTLEFVMGMSANERFGAMGNWTRMRFAEQDLVTAPDVFISTVVNNRADRVPRSRVFARMIVRDIAADRHVLIGSNIDGLLGFIEEEWDAFTPEITLADEKATPEERWIALARSHRIPTSQKEVDDRLAAMESGVSADQNRDNSENSSQFSAEREKWAAEIAGQYAEFEKLRGAIAGSADVQRCESDVRDFLGRVLMSRLVPVRDYHASGERIVRLLAQNSPPGLINRIMGMQNIKGTGLDFVYRWQAWEAVELACRQAGDENPVRAEKGLAVLGAFQEFGALSEMAVRTTIAELRDRPPTSAAASPAQLDAIEARMDAQLAEQVEEGTAGSGDGEAGPMARATAWLVSAAEGLLDGGDAINRRRKSDAIYRAMIAEQISTQRAALELKKLTSRQKGGWLGQAFDEMGGRARSLFTAARRS